MTTSILTFCLAATVTLAVALLITFATLGVGAYAAGLAFLVAVVIALILDPW